MSKKNGAKNGASVKKTKKVRTPRDPSQTKVGSANEMIVKGATNAEVTAMLREKFRMTVEKATRYASWYRSDLVQKGKITKDFAVKHRGSEDAAVAPKRKTTKVTKHTDGSEEISPASA